MQKQYKKLLTVKELAELVRLSPITIYRLVEQHEIPFIRVGRSIRFDPDAVFEFGNVAEKVRQYLMEEVFGDEPE
jgi:excisionase family DNA binding protein